MLATRPRRACSAARAACATAISCSRSTSRAARGAGGEPVVRAASRVEREWLARRDRAREVGHRFDEDAGAVRAFARDALRRPAARRAAGARGPGARGRASRRGPRAARPRARPRTLCGAGFAWPASRPTCTPPSSRPAAGRTRLPALDRPERGSIPRVRARLDRLAPERLAAAERAHGGARVPRGRLGRRRR